MRIRETAFEANKSKAGLSELAQTGISRQARDAAVGGGIRDRIQKNQQPTAQHLQGKKQKSHAQTISATSQTWLRELPVH